MLRQLTSGHWVVMNLLGFDAQKHNVIFAGNEVNPIGCNVFTVNVDTGERIRIDEGGWGWHDASLSGSGKWLLDRYQEPDVPRNIAFVDTRNGQNYSSSSMPRLELKDRKAEYYELSEEKCLQAVGTLNT